MTTPEMEIAVSSHDREEYERTEQWLDDHPDFVHDYFARKASRTMIDGWLIAHAITQTVSSSQLQVQNQTEPGSNESSSKASSGANTPVRKISAQEFEKQGILKPMVSTVDGCPTFLGPDPSTCTQTALSKVARKSRSELKQLDERELMYELVIDICNDLDVTSLCHKILLNVSILLNADRCSLFLTKGEQDSDERLLISKLFDVHSEATLEESVEKCSEIVIPWGTGIVGHVAKTGTVLNIPDAYEVCMFLLNVAHVPLRYVCFRSTCTFHILPVDSCFKGSLA